MNKQLTTKIQKINPPELETANQYAKAMVIDADDPTQLDKKGTLFFVASLNANKQIDTNLVEKILVDVLHDSYFQTEGISPIQTVEKAILEVRNKILKLSSDEDKIDFNIATAIHWGNTMYLVIYGNAFIHLMRDGAVKPVTTATEGKFSVASGLVKDGDVVILSTKEFNEEFPAESLFEQTELKNETLKPTQAALMIKFNVIKTFTQDEVVDFQNRENKDEVDKSKVAGTNAVATAAVASKMSFREKLAEKKAKKQKAKEEKRKAREKAKEQKQLKVEEENKKEKKNTKVAKTTMSNIGRTKAVKMKDPNTPKKGNKKLVGLVLFLLGLGIGGYLIFNYSGLNDNELNLDNSTQQEQQPDFVDDTFDQEPQDQQEEPIVDEFIEIDEEKDKRNNVIRVDEKAFFYDVTLADENAKPDELALFSDRIFALDTTTGQLYESELDVPKFNRVEDLLLTEAKSIFNDDGDLAVITNSSIQIYDAITKELKQEYEGTLNTIVSPYIGFLYEIENGQINKYTKGDGILEQEVWITTEELDNAISMGIDISIYVLTNDGRILKFTRGTQDGDYELEELEDLLQNPTQMVYNEDVTNFYIADAENNRVVVFNNSDGSLVKQYKAQDERLFDEIKHIVVSSNESKLYILAETSVYEIDL